MSQPPSGDPEQPPSPYERPSGDQSQWGQTGDQPQWGQPGGQPQWGPGGDQPQWGQQSGQPGEPSPWGQQSSTGQHGAGQHGEQPRWGQPEQPQYGQQPPYPPQGPYGQYGPPPGGGPNIMAILSLVFAFVFAPAGIVLGHLAKRQIQRTGEEGEQLATWGLILSYVFTVLGLLACCGWLGFAIWAGNDNGTRY
ncbi:DUF4190 domain-containing protein [Micromonospora sp. NPDC000089]|uniref:DUF4190 domain-containing protein n=1 Tax=unclassified Micromonospora TaxID=2617518 RepID=UPI003685A002